MAERISSSIGRCIAAIATGFEAAERITFDALKWSLRDEAAKIGASKWQRKETAILAADLLRMAEAVAPTEPGAKITVTQG